MSQSVKIINTLSPVAVLISLELREITLSVFGKENADKNFKKLRDTQIWPQVLSSALTRNSLSPEVTTKLSEFGKEKVDSNSNNSKDTLI